MKFDKEFKEAIFKLPQKEKDNLLIRLLKKDTKLSDRLYFELISDETVEGKRDELEKRITTLMNQFSNRYRTGKDLTSDMRFYSGEITYHVFVTKDKFGDAYLNAILVREGLKYYNSILLGNTTIGIQDLSNYLISKIFKILIQLTKVHEDYLIEIEDILREITALLAQNDNFIHACINNGLDLNWLRVDNIPNEIANVYKDIRSRGYLK
jgi:hypothetical protein